METRSRTDLRHRLPTVLGVAAAALLLFGADGPADAAPIIDIAATIYLAVAVAGDRRATWPAFVAVPLVFGAFAVLGFPDWTFALVAGSGLVLVGVLNRNLLTRGPESWQTPALVGFSLVAVLGTAVGPSAGVPRLSSALEVVGQVRQRRGQALGVVLRGDPVGHLLGHDPHLGALRNR